MLTRDHPNYYRASANPAPERPRLAESLRADVCVVGAGFTGLSCALELAQKGYEVVVLEQAEVAYGASGRNGGQVCTGFSAGMGKVEKAAGDPEVAKLAWQVADEAVRLVQDRIRDHAIDCDYRGGYLHVATKPAHVREFDEHAEELRRYGYRGETEILDKAGIHARVGSDAYIGALRESEAGHLHPLNYALGLAAAAEGAGARLFEHSPVVSVDTGSRPVRAVTEAGAAIEADHLVLAGNAYLGNLVPYLNRRIMPVSSYILATAPLGENRAREIIRDGEAVGDCNFIINYFRLSADNRLLFGGRAAYSGYEPRDLAAYMRPRMLGIFPQLDDVAGEYCWGGRIGITVDRIPSIGRIGAHTWYAQGFSGQGVALTGMYGKLIAEAIAGQAERFDVMSGFRPMVFPGGRLRTPLLTLAMLYYRLRDAL
jgi:gamma-glutamylputrescine oxidase